MNIAFPMFECSTNFGGAWALGGFRRINDRLVSEVLQEAPLRDKTVGLIDATDLPASTADKKKTGDPGARSGQIWGRAL